MIYHHISSYSPTGQHISSIETFKSKLRLVMHPINMPQWHHFNNHFGFWTSGTPEKNARRRPGTPKEKRINPMTSSKVHVNNHMTPMHESYQFKSLQWTNSSFLHSPCLCGSSKTNHISMSFKPHPCSGARLHHGEKASVMRRQGANSIGVAETHLLQGSPEISPKSGSFTIEVSGGLKQRKWLVNFFCFKYRWLKYWKRLKFYGVFVFFLLMMIGVVFFCMCKVSVALFWRKILVGSGSYFTHHDVVTEIW